MALSRRFEFTLMTQNTRDSDRKFTAHLSNHRILGSFAANGLPAAATGYGSPGEALSYSSADNSCYQLATSCSLQELPGGGAVVITGQPRFRDESLAEISRTRGYAAAAAEGYLAHGEKLFSAMQGGFCCAIVDTRENRVLVAIDRLGQQSLYYAANEGVLAFGSSADEVLKRAGIQDTISQTHRSQ